MKADRSFAFATNIPCTARDQGYAECEGNTALYCADGLVYAQACGLYTSASGTTATCDASTPVIDCVF